MQQLIAQAQIISSAGSGASFARQLGASCAKLVGRDLISRRAFDWFASNRLLPAGRWLAAGQAPFALLLISACRSQFATGNLH